jgi:hypothetical protein
MLLFARMKDFMLRLVIRLLIEVLSWCCILKKPCLEMENHFFDLHLDNWFDYIWSNKY